MMHAGVLSIAVYGMHGTPAAPLVEEPPLVVSLNRPSTLEKRRLIDGGAPSEAPAKPTDFITDENTQAQDLNDEQEGTDRPFVEEVSDVDQVAHPGGVTPEEAPPAPEIAEPAPDPSESEPSEFAEKVAEPIAEEPSEALSLEPLRREDPLPVSEVLQDPEADRAPDARESPPAPEDLPERFEIAKAPTLKLGPPSLPAPGSSRVRGGIRKKGFMSFEAHEHLLAPYLLKIRKAVERQWRTGLHFRFSGSSRALAVIDCAIAPDGSIVFARIVDPGRSASYASLCRRAVESAGPFEPFPFEVPEVYRSQSLEIRWTFSYM